MSANRLIRETLANIIAKHAVAGSVPVPDVAGLPGNLDMVLVDAHDTGHTTLTQLAKQLTRTKLIIMNADWQGLNVAECVRFGTVGFIVTDAPTPLFLATILAVHDGLKVIPPAILDKLLWQLNREHQQDHTLSASDAALTVKEQQIRRFLLDGLTNKEISATLNISEATVKTHVGHILQKLQCRSRAELIQKHFRNQIMLPRSAA